MFDSHPGLVDPARELLLQALEQLDTEELDVAAALELTAEFPHIERMCAAARAALAGAREVAQGHNTGNDHGPVVQAPADPPSGPSSPRPGSGGDR